MSERNDVENGLDASSQEEFIKPKKWSFGILNDKKTDEVPGSVLLLSKVSKRQEPLGLRHAPARTSSSSLPSPFRPALSRQSSTQTSIRRRKKRTPDGAIILDPQPDDSLNDPLNWPVWRRNAALLSLGFYCMVGGGMTPILAAGFNNVASTYNVTIPQVALTTGLYMLGLGIGSVLMSPTAILYGKRPVYLSTAVAFVLSSVWCASSPTYTSLLVARIFQGLAVSPVECLPSATIAEIFFLHERAYRLGIYTLLLLGGKNLIPFVSAVIIEDLGWRWTFWIVAIVVGFQGILLFFFVPETFWDRTPRPRHSNEPRDESIRKSHLPRFLRRSHTATSTVMTQAMTEKEATSPQIEGSTEPLSQPTGSRDVRVAFEDPVVDKTVEEPIRETHQSSEASQNEKSQTTPLVESRDPTVGVSGSSTEKQPALQDFTDHHQSAPLKSYRHTLKPYSGRLTNDRWLRVACRPFILYTYPAVLWSALVYSLSVGWLIVLSECVSKIYKDRDSYNFTSFQTGLVYLSPFVGAILGTAVAGRVSDLIVRFMSRRNDGLYEPEYRLVMGLPIAISTTIGLMGFGWSAEEKDLWIVPTIFFGVISFGCSLGSTTAITFCVDSYRQYAGEALVTLNFSKNVFHGFVFSLFVTGWLERDGSKKVFIVIGVIHLVCLLFTIPLYIYGKRARMWTVRRNLMERF